MSGYEQYYLAAMRDQGLAVAPEFAAALEAESTSAVPISEQATQDTLVFEGNVGNHPPEGNKEGATPAGHLSRHGLAEPLQQRHWPEIPTVAKASGAVLLTGRFAREQTTAESLAMEPSRPTPAITTIQGEEPPFVLRFAADAQHQVQVITAAPQPTPSRTIPPRSSQEHPVDVMAMFRAAAEEEALADEALARQHFQTGKIEEAGVLLHGVKNFGRAIENTADQFAEHSWKTYSINKDMMERFSRTVAKETERMKQESVRQRGSVALQTVHETILLEEAVGTLRTLYEGQTATTQDATLEELRQLRAKHEAERSALEAREAARKAHMAAEIKAADARRAGIIPEAQPVTAKPEPFLALTEFQPESAPEPARPRQRLLRRLAAKIGNGFSRKQRRALKAEQALPKPEAPDEADDFIAALNRTAAEEETPLQSTPAPTPVPVSLHPIANKPTVAEMVRAARARDGVYALQVVAEQQLLARQGEVRR